MGTTHFTGKGGDQLKIALKDGQVFIKEPNNNQLLIIKSWGKMKWSKADLMFYGPEDAELLNKLSEIVKLPELIEKRRKYLNAVSAAIDRERMNENPKPLCKYPVKLPLYKHQIRGANMALIAFGLIDPGEKEEKGQD